jgi:hypothetical protein
LKKKKPLPHFESEGDEARWYYAHRHELDDFFGAPRPAEGNLAGRLGLQRTTPRSASARMPSEQISVRFPHDDLDALKAIAARKGLGYQTLLKSLVHEFVVKEQRTNLSAP